MPDTTVGPADGSGGGVVVDEVVVVDVVDEVGEVGEVVDVGEVDGEVDGEVVDEVVDEVDVVVDVDDGAAAAAPAASLVPVSSEPAHAVAPASESTATSRTNVEGATVVRVRA